jgi:hypothetical protein
VLNETVILQPKLFTLKEAKRATESNAYSFNTDISCGVQTVLSVQLFIGLLSYENFGVLT